MYLYHTHTAPSFDAAGVPSQQSRNVSISAPHTSSPSPIADALCRNRRPWSRVAIFDHALTCVPVSEHTIWVEQRYESPPHSADSGSREIPAFRLASAVSTLTPSSSIAGDSDAAVRSLLPLSNTTSTDNIMLNHSLAVAWLLSSDAPSVAASLPRQIAAITPSSPGAIALLTVPVIPEPTLKSAVAATAASSIQDTGIDATHRDPVVDQVLLPQDAPRDDDDKCEVVLVPAQAHDHVSPRQVEMETFSTPTRYTLLALPPAASHNHHCVVPSSLAHSAPPTDSLMGLPAANVGATTSKAQRESLSTLLMLVAHWRSGSLLTSADTWFSRQQHCAGIGNHSTSFDVEGVREALTQLRRPPPPSLQVLHSYLTPLPAPDNVPVVLSKYEVRQCLWFALAHLHSVIAPASLPNPPRLDFSSPAALEPEFEEPFAVVALPQPDLILLTTPCANIPNVIEVKCDEVVSVTSATTSDAATARNSVDQLESSVETVNQHTMSINPSQEYSSYRFSSEMLDGSVAAALPDTPLAAFTLSAPTCTSPLNCDIDQVAPSTVHPGEDDWVQIAPIVPESNSNSVDSVVISTHDDPSTLALATNSHSESDSDSASLGASSARLQDSLSVSSIFVQIPSAPEHQLSMSSISLDAPVALEDIQASVQNLDDPHASKIANDTALPASLVTESTFCEPSSVIVPASIAPESFLLTPATISIASPAALVIPPTEWSTRNSPPTSAIVEAHTCCTCIDLFSCLWLSRSAIPSMPEKDDAVVSSSSMGSSTAVTMEMSSATSEASTANPILTVSTDFLNTPNILLSGQATVSLAQLSAMLQCELWLQGTHLSDLDMKAPELRSRDNVDGTPELRLRKFPFVHLIFMVHGYAGNSWDMRLTKNIMAVLVPDATIVCSVCNESNTDDDIATLGRRLADEVARYADSDQSHSGWSVLCANVLSMQVCMFVNHECHPHLCMCMDVPRVDYLCVFLSSIRDIGGERRLSRLSFIGHSLGGVIIRAALTSPSLKPHLSKLYTLITFGYTSDMFCSHPPIIFVGWPLLNCKRMYICMHLCLYVCMSVCMYVCMYVCMCVCVCVCLCVCMSCKILFVHLSCRSPHCGFLSNDSVLLSSGMYVIQKWSKSISLQQLALEDHADPQQAYLFHLSQQRGTCPNLVSTGVNQ
jgi:hypothetical protein